MLRLEEDWPSVLDWDCLVMTKECDRWCNMVVLQRPGNSQLFVVDTSQFVLEPNKNLNFTRRKRKSVALREVDGSALLQRQAFATFLLATSESVLSLAFFTKGLQGGDLLLQLLDA